MTRRIGLSPWPFVTGSVPITSDVSDLPPPRGVKRFSALVMQRRKRGACEASAPPGRAGRPRRPAPLREAGLRPGVGEANLRHPRRDDGVCPIRCATPCPSYDIDAVPTTFATTWTWADLRKGAEAMNPFAYFQYRYYEKWLGGITAYLLDHGYLTRRSSTPRRDASARTRPRRCPPPRTPRSTTRSSATCARATRRGAVRRTRPSPWGTA